MAEQTHVCRDITIFPVVAIVFAGKAEPLKEVPRSARTARVILLRCACAAGDVARLAVLVCVGPEAGIALVLAGPRLQPHSNRVQRPTNRVGTLVALGACSIQGCGALQALFRALRATLVDHIGEHVIWAVVDALGTLQEEAALAFLAFCDQSAIANSAIRMALDAHRELLSCPTNRLQGLEVAVPTITLHQGIFAILDTVCRRIENHRASAGKALGVQRTEAFLAAGMTGLARCCSHVKVEARLACTVAKLRAVQNGKASFTSAEGAGIQWEKVQRGNLRDEAPTAEFMALSANLICWVLVLVLLANSQALCVLCAKRALFLARLLSASSLHHCRYLFLSHGMLVNPDLIEDVTSRRDKPHLISS
jgi:hypothetical protein